MNVFWHRRDLRIKDNKGLKVAGQDTVPVYIFDPDWLTSSLVSDARISFVIESLRDLNRQYLDRGSHLVLLHGEPEKILQDMEDEHEIYLNRDANHFNQEREKKVRKRYNTVSLSPATNHRVNRDNWGSKVTEWFSSEPIAPPQKFQKPSFESDVTLDQIKQKYDINPEKEKFGKGGTKPAINRLEKFKQNIGNYSGSISSPSKAENNTSHLSPYLRYGCLSPREVYKSVKSSKNSSNRRSVELFLDRIVWQQHFRKKLEDNPDLFKEAINPVYRDLNREKRDQNKIDAWKNGKTGYPLVDASMRALSQTGWINFRMRAMCASFYSYILKQWWKEGADHFYKHLIDADVAINYYQWQMQSGLVGVHANRIYNPSKQVEENDPEGVFIRKYVPELRSVPDKYLSKPWKMSPKKQSECGARIGKNYPEPIVNYDREARKARKYFEKKAPEAYSAFSDDEVWEKASLSSRHSREEILEKAGSSQKDLSDF